MSLAETNKLLPYSLLQEELGISTVRELEDLIIEVAAREICELFNIGIFRAFHLVWLWGSWTKRTVILRLIL